MSTKAQIKANKKNAKKSTGPRTPQGKATVSQNAVKHGLFAIEPVIFDEDQAEFDFHREQMLAEWAPVGYMETILAERIVSLSWRLRRAERMQSQAIEVKYKRDIISPLARLDHKMDLQLEGLWPDDMGPHDERLAIGNIAIKDFANNKVLGQLILYERRIENSMYRTMDKLRKLQGIRKAEDAAAEKQDRALRKRARAAMGLPARECNLWSERENEVKKQSQFAPAREGVKSFGEGGYENNFSPEPAEKRADQSQFQAPTADNPGEQGEFDSNYARQSKRKVP